MANVAFANGQVVVNGQTIGFNALVAQAYLDRVQLWSDGFYATPKVHWDRHAMQGRPFLYFAYGAAVSEVVIDTLTGESKLLRADLLIASDGPRIARNKPTIFLGSRGGISFVNIEWKRIAAFPRLVGNIAVIGDAVGYEHVLPAITDDLTA